MTSESPAAAVVLADFYRRVVAPRMAGLPFVNPRLAVEAVGFRRHDGQWLGAMVLPWSLNLVLLPDRAEAWPALSPGATRRVAFRAGGFEFVAAVAADVGEHHDCSLFSPALEFVDQAAARATALAALAALVGVDDLGRFDLDSAAPRAEGRSRRGFLGLRTTHGT